MNLEPLLQASLAIQIHAIGAIVALVLGSIVLFRKKGDRFHRLGGRIWVAIMVIVALSSFAINEIRVWGDYSPIHILSIVTLVSLAQAVIYARKRQIRAHKLTLKGLYFGALIVAGGFTLLPGRIMSEVFFGAYTGPRTSIEMIVGVAFIGALAAYALVQRFGDTADRKG